MTKRARVIALAVLHVAVLSSGIGMAMAHGTQPTRVQGQVPAALPATSYEPPALRPRATRPTASPRAARPKATPRVVRTQVTPSKPPAARKPPPRPKATATASAPAPLPVTRSLSAQERLMAVVTRIPGYRPGEALWVIKPGLGTWGLAVMGGATVYVAPDVPADRLYDVVAHEWSHLLTIKAYGGDVTGAIAAMTRYFGGSDLMGAERAADCMARLLGASWTNYTPCTDATWREGARRLLNRQRL